MKPIITLALLLLLCFCTYAQPVQITNTSGTATYDGVNISVTSTGTVATSGSPCSGTTTDYQVSPPGAAPGQYLYTCSAPVYALQIHAYNINGGAIGLGEYLQVQINGAPYTLTAADISSYSECGSRGTGNCYLDSGRLYGPAGTPTANMNGGDITIHYCAGITSFALYGGNPDSGIQYNVWVDTTRLPAPAVITGATTICAGSLATLNATPAGGTWSSSNSSVVRIGSATGVATGVTSGTATISYTYANSCGSTTTTLNFTVVNAPFVSPITGPGSVCVGQTITLTDAATGGIWTSSNNAVATTGSTTGIVTGVSAGTDVIEYLIDYGPGCMATAAYTVTVNALPPPSSITGIRHVCPGASAALSAIPTSGTWSSSDTTVATIITSGGSGIVTGASVGTATISYTLTNGCGATSATATFTVDPGSIAGPISGPSLVCTGLSVTLTDTAHGTWSATNGHATVGAATGLVRGVTAGVDTIIFAPLPSSSGCVSGVITHIVTVDIGPVVNPITGAGELCAGSSVTLTETATGGVWSASNAHATVAAGGVAGITGGVDTIAYAITYACGTATAIHLVTVHATPVTVSHIAGADTLCVGSSATLTDTIPGGTWSSTTGAIAVIGSASGIINGIAAGNTTVTYTISNICGTASATRPVTVIPPLTVAAITGPAAVCIGSYIILSDANTGGVWSVSNTHAAIAADTVTGVTAGTATISYTVTGFCNTVTATLNITVDASAATVGRITGPDSVCVGSSIILTDGSTGGVWSSSNTAMATAATTSGSVRGVAAGTAIISYVLGNACGADTAALPITVIAPAVPSAITGPSVVCLGHTVSFTDSTIGGYWNSSSPNIRLSGDSSIVTGITEGSATISYAVSSYCGTFAAVKTVTVGADAGNILNERTCCIDTIVTMRDDSTGGTWSSGNVFVATVDSATGGIIAYDTGTVTITYTMPGGCYTTALIHLINCNGVIPENGIGTVNQQNSFTFYPNPATQQLTISAAYNITTITISNPAGQKVFSNSYNKREVQLDIARLPAGMYFIQVNGGVVRKFVKE